MGKPQPDLDEMVTISRFDTDLREMVFIIGNLLDFVEGYCCSNLSLKIPDVGSFIREARENHHILIYGDHAEGVTALCGAFGIPSVAVPL